VGCSQDVALTDEASAAEEGTITVDLVLEQCHPGKIAGLGGLSPADLGICGASALHLTDLVMNCPRYIPTVDPNDPLHERTILVLNALT